MSKASNTTAVLLATEGPEGLHLDDYWRSQDFDLTHCHLHEVGYQAREFEIVVLVSRTHTNLVMHIRDCVRSGALVIVMPTSQTSSESHQEWHAAGAMFVGSFPAGHDLLLKAITSRQTKRGSLSYRDITICPETLHASLDGQTLSLTIGEARLLWKIVSYNLFDAPCQIESNEEADLQALRRRIKKVRPGKIIRTLPQKGARLVAL